jgi:predicted ATPase
VTSQRGLLLLQEPEIHLHPRAQAALGSFFSQLVAKKKKEVVIETHSDYLLDRVRLEVANGTIPADKVLILFFDKHGFETHVHQIMLDENGTLLNVPPTYREFFLKEEMNLFSRASK